jgi:hypothetical protein
MEEINQVPIVIAAPAALAEPAALAAPALEMTFTQKELDNYSRQKEECKFKTPTEEYMWASTQPKKCSKCKTEKKLTDYAGNTSGRDAFDKNGYRLRRPECNECKKTANKGNLRAIKIAKEAGIPYKAPEGTVCAICTKPPTSGNGLVFDHCHQREIFRGYCCNSCNRSVGVLGDDVDGVLRVLNYLLKSEKSTIMQQADGTLVKMNE